MNDNSKLGLFLVAIIGITYLVASANPYMLDNVSYYVNPALLNAIMITALAFGGFYFTLPSLSDANQFIRSIRSVKGIGCPHGFMDNDICPTCGRSGQLAESAGLIR